MQAWESAKTKEMQARLEATLKEKDRLANDLNIQRNKQQVEQERQTAIATIDSARKQNADAAKKATEEIVEKKQNAMLDERSRKNAIE